MSYKSQNMKNTNAFHMYFGTGPFKHTFFAEITQAFAQKMHTQM